MYNNDKQVNTSCIEVMAMRKVYKYIPWIVCAGLGLVKLQALAQTAPLIQKSDFTTETGTVAADFTRESDLPYDATRGYGWVDLNDRSEVEAVEPSNQPQINDNINLQASGSGVNLDTPITANLRLAGGAGLNPNTVIPANVRLYVTATGQSIAGTVNTSAAGDVLVFQPSENLEPNTTYTFEVSSDVKDSMGNSFIPYAYTFTTGTSIGTTFSGNISFTKQVVYTAEAITSLVMGPNNRLYGSTITGKLIRWTVEPDGSLSNEQTFYPAVLQGRVIVGLAFDPSDENVIWITNNQAIFPHPADDFTGKISKVILTGELDSFNGLVEDYIVGLPRSARDHLSNSLAFHNGKLYLSQGSNNSMGAPDSAWFNRPQRLLTSSILEIDPYLSITSPINVQTEDYTTKDGTFTTGNYNPYASDAPVRIYASGVRNAYDLVWHSNGYLYAPNNGAGAGGNVPDNPNTSINEAVDNVSLQNDYLYKIVPGGYYGHPNPLQGYFILNGGNPTAEVDSAEVVTSSGYNGYPVGIQPELNYRGFTYDFGRNRSPNGAIEYKSDAFNGQLRGRLIVAEYSAGDDLIAISFDSAGNVASTPISIAGGFINPLDVAEGNNGNLYVSEVSDEFTARGQITLLKPQN